MYTVLGIYTKVQGTHNTMVVSIQKFRIPTIQWWFPYQCSVYPQYNGGFHTNVMVHKWYIWCFPPLMFRVPIIQWWLPYLCSGYPQFYGGFHTDVQSNLKTLGVCKCPMTSSNVGRSEKIFYKRRHSDKSPWIVPSKYQSLSNRARGQFDPRQRLLMLNQPEIMFMLGHMYVKV